MSRARHVLDEFGSVRVPPLLDPSPPSGRSCRSFAQNIKAGAPSFESIKEITHTPIQNRWAGAWEEKWREKCNGKLLLEAMRRDGHFRGDLLRLKKAVIARMRTQKTETYSALRAMLGDLIGAPA
jgi:hypothetical protein